MRKNCIIIQDGIKECGSACLLSIIRYYGGNVSMPRLLELTSTTKEGTNFYNLTSAADEIGLSSKGYKINSLEEIQDINMPFISQVIINNYHHFIVIYKINDNVITIMDPAKGMVKMSKKDFEQMWTGYILLFTPYKSLPSFKENDFLSEAIEAIIENNQKMILNLIVLTLIVTIFTCIYNYHFKIMLDNYLYTNNLSLIIITIIFTVIILIKLTVEYLRNNLLLYLNEKIDLSIITTTISRIIYLPYSYYKNKTTGETIARINDLLYVKNVLSKMLIIVFLDLGLSIVIMIILFSINKEMTLFLLLIAILYLLIFLIYQKRTRKVTNNLQENTAKTNSILVESISSYETIKGLTLEDIFKNKINKQYLNTIKDNISLTKIINDQTFLRKIFESIIILIITYLGIVHVKDKSLSIGSLITYNSLIIYFTNPISNLLDFYKDIYYMKNSINRINNLFNYQYEEMELSSNLEINGNILINDLTFNYDNKNTILKHLNLNIKDKSKVLLLGTSGSGKSTLLKLIYGYYLPDNNKIYLNNYDILDFRLSDLRRSITYVSQNEFLFTDTIKNNIILNRNIKESEFLFICKITYIDEIVKDNPLSYNMPLEENGANISGGQRQRIILARALLKKSKIILLDEVLNEVDINLERKILKNIFLYYKEKTFIIISHRKNNIDLYDNVIMLENGEVKGDLVKNEWHIRN